MYSLKNIYAKRPANNGRVPIINSVVAADVYVIPKIKKMKAKANATPPSNPVRPTLMKLCRNAKPSL